MKSAVYFEAIGQDVVYSLRTMGRSPAFAVTAMLILALGIGGNTAIFTMIRAVLLRPLDYGNPDRLVYFSVENPKQPLQDTSFSLKQFEEMSAPSILRKRHSW
jgi:hypothetical protein